MADEMQSLNFDFKTTGIDKSVQQIETLNKAFNKLVNRINSISKLDLNVITSASRRLGTLGSKLSSFNLSGKGVESAMEGLKKIPSVINSVNKIDSSALEKFNSRIQTLTSTLSPLATQLKTIQAGFKEVDDKAKQASEKVVGVTDAHKDLEKNSGSIKETLSKIKTWWIAVAMAIRKAISGIGKSYNEFADYIEAINLYKSTMGSSATGEVLFARQVESELGIDIKQWMTMQGTVQQMARGFGVSNDMATKMSRNLTQLAYDISSIYNEDVEESMQRINSAMTGQVKGIREYGIETTVAALQEFALSKGIDKSVSSMTMAEKAWLRYELIMERTTNLQGNLGRELLSPANSMRVLSNQVNILKRNLGAVISVVATKVIPYLQVFVEYVADAAKSLADLFGVDIDAYFESIGDINLEFAEGLENTEEEAEKLKKTLMGFDEINTIGSNKTDSGLFGDYSWIYNQPLYEYNILDSVTKEIEGTADRIREKLSNLGVTGFVDALKDVIKGMKDISETEAFKKFMSGAGMVIMNALETTTRNIASHLSGIADLLQLDIGGFLYKTFLKPIYQIILGIQKLWHQMKGNTYTVKYIDGLMNNLNNDDVGAFDFGKIFNGLDGSIEKEYRDRERLLKDIDDFAVTLVTGDYSGAFLLGDENAEKWKRVVADYLDTAKKAGLKVSEEFAAFANELSIPVEAAMIGVNEVEQHSLESLTTFYENVKNKRDKYFQMFADYSTWDNSAAFDTMTKEIYTLLDDIGIYTGNKIQQTIYAIEKGILDISAFADAEILTGSTFLKSKYTEALNAIKGKWKTTFPNVEATIQAAQGGDSFAKFLISTGGGVGYANGGYPDQGELFFANEAGPELVGTIGGRTAVASNNDILESMYRVMREAMSASGGNGGSTTVNLNLDGERVAQAVYNSHNNTVRQTGHSPLLV